MELRSHIAERVEHGQTVDDALRQLGDPMVLAESYLAAIPLIAASFWPRAAARLIDFFGFVCALRADRVACCSSQSRPELASSSSSASSCDFADRSACIYPVIAEYRYGKTVGKHLMGLRVVRESGARISFGQSVVRQLPMLTAGVVDRHAVRAVYRQASARFRSCFRRRGS